MNFNQNKGRLERANISPRIAWVKELRLQGISTIKQVNLFLSAFVDDYDQHSAKPPRNSKNMHRPLSDLDQLDRYMSWQEERIVSNNLTIQYNRVVFIIEPNDFTIDLNARKSRSMITRMDAWKYVLKASYCPTPNFDKVSQVKQSQFVNNKRLGAVLAAVKQQQEERSFTRSKKAPKRRGQENSVFS